MLNIKINEEYNKKIFEKVVIIKLFKVLELKIKNKFIIVKFKNDENERIDLYKNLNFNYLKEDEEVYFKRKV